MKHYALYDPVPFWKGEASHIVLSMHRAQIITREEGSWMQVECPGFVLCDRDGVVEVFFGDLVEFGRGAKPKYFDSIEAYNGKIPPIENRRQIIDKIDNEFLSLCKREGIL